MMKRLWSFVLLMCMAASLATAQPQGNAGILGTYARIQVAVADLPQSMAWYARLGFFPVKGGEKSDSVLTVSDNQTLLTLTTSKVPSPVVVFRNDNLKALYDTLQALGVRVQADLAGPTYRELRLTSPAGIYILVRPSTVEPALAISNSENIMCGRLTELSINVQQIRQELNWWTELGFSITRQGTEPYIFGYVSDGALTLSFHVNKEIPSLALTYFAKDMEQRIDRIKKSGISAIDEIPTADNRIANAIFKSDDGQLIMLFEEAK
jgi:hypothetical protein